MLCYLLLLRGCLVVTGGGLWVRCGVLAVVVCQPTGGGRCMFLFWWGYAVVNYRAYLPAVANSFGYCIISVCVVLFRLGCWFWWFGVVVMLVCCV
jgi:hypothetical protein